LMKFYQTPLVCFDKFKNIRWIRLQKNMPYFY
jgi:hypothetical protein